MNDRLPDLNDTLRSLWRRKILIVSIAALTTFGSVLFATQKPKVFAASTRLVIHPLVSGATFTSISSNTRDNGPLGLDVSSDTQVQIVRSPVVADRVIRALGLGLDAHVLLGQMSARLVTDQLIEITAASTSPAFAAALADSFADEYLNYRRNVAEVAITSAASDLRQRLQSLREAVGVLDTRIIKLVSEGATTSGSPTDPRKAQISAEVTRLAEERNSLISELGTVRAKFEDVNSVRSPAGGGEIISRAVAPVRAYSPRPRRDGTLGAVLGLLFAAALAFVLGRFDDRVRTFEDANRAAALPIVAAIPRTRAWRRRRDAYLASLLEPGSQTVEAYRELRATLAASGLGRTIRSIVVTSSEGGEGKSATAANLAVVCAQSGLRVVALSADLRKPRLHAFFGLRNDSGLSQVLDGNINVRQGLQATAVPNLYVLPSGPPVVNASVVLDSKKLDDVLKELLMGADLVIIDAPPIEAGADALVVAPRTDVAMVVIRQELARIGKVGSAVHSLTKAGARHIVGVLTLTASRSPGRPYFDLPPVSSNGHEVAANGDVPTEVVLDDGRTTRSLRRRTLVRRTEEDGEE